MTKPPLLLQDRVAEYIIKHGLISPGDHLLAAVSGGPDSVALLHILISLKAKFRINKITVAHFNHRLRGNDSEADCEFVRGLAGRAGLDFRSGSEDVRSFASKEKISIEMAARELRHSFFKRIARELNARKTALGHTADDQAEEVLLRLLRGTGPAGIGAMPPGTPDGLIRPLLFATRDDILEHLSAGNIPYREDSSNSEPFCQRNLLRLQIFPLLREGFHRGISGTISRYAELAAEEQSWWAAQVQGVWKELCSKQTEDRVELDRMQLKVLHPSLLRRILRHALLTVRGNLSGIGSVHLEPLVSALLADDGGKSVRFPGGVEAVQERERLVIGKIQPAFPAFETISVPGPGTYRFGEHTLEIALLDARIPSDPTGKAQDLVLMDEAKIRWPMELRPWRPGDRFRPLGMTGSKKLQDFFVDAGVPRTERHRTALLCDREKICWIAGLRMDDRVKVTSHTSIVVQARLITGC